MTDIKEMTELKDGEPCSHPGCLLHVTHPCEGCGRVSGRTLPKDMTDAKLVEAVVREVLGYDIVSAHPNDVGAIAVLVGKALLWINLLHDMNDLFMVIGKYNDWRIDNWHGEYTVSIWPKDKDAPMIEVSRIQLFRAVLEAALMAERGKK